MIKVGNSQNPCILIVDDEPEILNSLADLLRKNFYVLASSDTVEALTILSKQDTVTIVISDQRMPVMTGAEFLAIAARVRPDTARILMTAYADLPAVVEAVNKGGIVQYITKPWNSTELLDTLKLIAERHILYQENRSLVNQLIWSVTPAVGSGTPGSYPSKSSATGITGENLLLKQALIQIKRSRSQLDSVQNVVPICMICGMSYTVNSSHLNIQGVKSENPHLIGHGYCQKCLVKIKTSPDTGQDIQE